MNARSSARSLSRRLGALALAGAAAFAVAAPAQAEEAPAHDLAVHYSSSMLKAEGFAGGATLRVSNVGTQRYAADYGTARFLVKVRTVDGPEGVDRIITPHSRNGSHVRDLGFDEATSTRSFEVILSNPVEKGADVPIAHFSFGDGLTREGRLIQSIETTQTARLDDDTSTGNDQGVDSQGTTTSGVGTSLSGRF